MANKLMKADIVNSVVEKAGLSKKDAAAAVDAFTATVQEALSNGNTVALIGFGTFEVRHRNARQGRNPQTGEPLQIEAKDVPAFKPGKQLRDAVS